MNITILTTPGCLNCGVLETMLKQLGVNYDLIDVTDNPEYLTKYPIFTAPGLIINGKLMLTGVPKYDKLKKLIADYR
ncbi:MAG: thioredoxin family protein [Nitrosarchaeum sp.]|nr:thioredoxin family protein [Nitrosarchaeum sp.]